MYRHNNLRVNTPREQQTDNTVLFNRKEGRQRKEKIDREIFACILSVTCMTRFEMARTGRHIS